MFSEALAIMDRNTELTQSNAVKDSTITEQQAQIDSLKAQLKQLENSQ